MYQFFISGVINAKNVSITQNYVSIGSYQGNEESMRLAAQLGYHIIVDSWPNLPIHYDESALSVVVGYPNMSVSFFLDAKAPTKLRREFMAKLAEFLKEGRP